MHARNLTSAKRRVQSESYSRSGQMIQAGQVLLAWSIASLHLAQFHAYLVLHFDQAAAHEKGHHLYATPDVFINFSAFLAETAFDWINLL
jgi:hypothetical protein